MTEELATPRFPELAHGDGLYESYYLTAHDPRGGRAVWIRYTVHQRPGHERTGSLWCTYFDAADGPPVAGKLTVGAADVAAPASGLVAIGDAELSPARARGALVSPTLDAAWALSISGAERELRHLPSDWMYDAPLPRTKSLTPLPAARFDGHLKIAGRDVAVDGWTGVLGHNWGGEHAERWIWLHCGAFTDRRADTWLDVVLGRVRVGPVVLPWLASGALSLDGERIALGGPRRARATKVEETQHDARFVLTGDDVRVEGQVVSPPGQVVAWRYASPDLDERHSAHSSVADLVVHVRRTGGGALTLSATGTATYELGTRPDEHGVAVQPYADGVLG